MYVTQNSGGGQGGLAQFFLPCPAPFFTVYKILHPLTPTIFRQKSPTYH